MTIRIGLITPYMGYNQGDGAIQEEIITRLRQIEKNIVPIGITLYPAGTSVLHAVDAYPISELVVKDYSERDLLFAGESLPTEKGMVISRVAESAPSDKSSETTAQSIVRFLRDLKHLPIAGPILRWVVFRLRDVQSIATELAGIGRAIRFARKLDLLVVAGGGQLDEAHGGAWGHPYVLFRWALIARLSGTPLAIISVGSARIETWMTQFFISQCLRTALYRSYRDIGTRNQLSKWSFTQNDPIIRDLALGIKVEQYLRNYEIPETPSIVAISPIYHNEPDYDGYDKMVISISDLIHYLVGSGHQVLIYRTTSVERFVIQDIRDQLNEIGGETLNSKVKDITAETFQQLMTRLAKADLVIASRLHSIILSHVLYKPTLAISWDRKVSAHMQDLEQDSYMIPIKDVDYDRLFEVFNQLKSNAHDIRDHIKANIENFQCPMIEQYEKLVELATLR